HVEPGVAEVAKPLRHRQRQVEQRRLAADGKPHSRQFRLRLLRGGEDGGGEQHRRGRQRAFHRRHHHFFEFAARRSTSAQCASDVISLKLSKSTLSFLPAGLPALRSASACSTARATRKMSEVGYATMAKPRR